MNAQVDAASPERQGRPSLADCDSLGEHLVTRPSCRRHCLRTLPFSFPCVLRPVPSKSAKLFVVLKLQTRLRRQNAVVAVEVLRVARRVRCAKCVQRVWRARRRLRWRRERREGLEWTNAVMMQRYLRGCMVRLYMYRMKLAQVVFSRMWRAFFARKYDEMDTVRSGQKSLVRGNYRASVP